VSNAFVNLLIEPVPWNKVKTNAFILKCWKIQDIGSRLLECIHVQCGGRPGFIRHFLDELFNDESNNNGNRKSVINGIYDNNDNIYFDNNNADFDNNNNADFDNNNYNINADQLPKETYKKTSKRTFNEIQDQDQHFETQIIRNTSNTLNEAKRFKTSLNECRKNLHEINTKFQQLQQEKRNAEENFEKLLHNYSFILEDPITNVNFAYSVHFVCFIYFI